MQRSSSRPGNKNRMYIRLVGLLTLLVTTYVVGAGSAGTIFNPAGGQQTWVEQVSGYFAALGKYADHSWVGFGLSETPARQVSVDKRSDRRDTLVGTGHRFNSNNRGSATFAGNKVISTGQAPAQMVQAAALMVKVNPNKYGVWGNGSLSTPTSLNPYAEAGVELAGYNLYVDWSELQPHNANEFDWSALDDKLDQLDEQPGLRYTIQIQVGQNSPQWVMDAAGYFTTTGHSQTGPYPNYLSSLYQQYYYAMLQAVSEHFRTYSTERRRKLISWQITEGTTGDTGYAHGDMNKCYKPNGQLMSSCATYEISDPAWSAFRIAAWHQVYDIYQPPVRLMFNPGNNAEDLDTIIDNFPNSNYKSGDLSHRMSFDTEKVYFERGATFNDSLSNAYRDRGEVQSISAAAFWQNSPIKLSFVLIGSALAGGLDMLNWTSEAIGLVGNDSPALAFFNKYSDYRRASIHNGAKRGFSALRDVIDFADTVRFPESTDGTLVPLASKKAYDNRVAEIIAEYGTEKPLYAAYRLSDTKVEFINQARIDAIKLKFPTAGWAPGDGVDPDTRDTLRHDYGIEVAGNYEKFVTQIDPNGTTNPRWRVGASFDASGNDLNDSQFYGRYAREFKLVGGKGTMYFKVDPGLANASAANKSNITVTYYDEGTADWSITVSGSKLAVKNTNSKKFLTKTLTVNNFKFGGKLFNASDIMLELTSGKSFAVVLVEFENTSKVAAPGPAFIADPPTLKN